MDTLTDAISLIFVLLLLIAKTLVFLKIYSYPLFEKKDNIMRINKNSFNYILFSTMLPITMQSILSSSFSVIDQVMIGSLGSTSIAAVGLVGKFSSFFSVILASIVAVLSIMLSQYEGADNRSGERRVLKFTTIISLLLSLVFIIPSLFAPRFIMKLYIDDVEVIKEAIVYLRIISLGFIPTSISLIYSTVLRCHNKASKPLYATFFSAIINSVLNYVFIYTLSLGVMGAALATLISQVFTLVAVFIMGFGIIKKEEEKKETPDFLSSFIKILIPIVVCEFFWGLGENVYASVYGHLGRSSAAAMSLTNPIQSLFIGALTGLSQASGILIGKELGKKDYESAYKHSKSIIRYGLFFSIILSAVVILIRSTYLKIYNVEEDVVRLTYDVLFVYALYAPIKVENMIIGGGIVRSGGRTDLVMYVDLIGTWVFGVPLALLSSRVLKLSLPFVYAFLTFEECIRLFIVSKVFVSKKWMESLE